MAFEQQKEAYAEQIVRLIRLMPDYPGGIMFGMGDAQQATAAVLYEQKTQDMYFKIFDIAFSFSSGFNNSSGQEEITMAVDIVELVKNKLSSKE